MVTGTLLERGGDLEALDALLASARAGSGGLILLHGAAGLGKTSLLEAVEASAGATGMYVLSARGDDLEQRQPWGLLRRLLAPLAAARHGAWFTGAAAPALSLWDTQVDASTPRFGDPLSLIHSLFWLTANVASEQPVAIVIDDAHWVDEMSLRFVRYLLPRLADLQVAVMIACRPNEPGAERSELEAIASSEDAHTRTLRPLSGEAVHQLLTLELEDEVALQVSDACNEVSGGNPFYLHELARELASRRASGEPLRAATVYELTPAGVIRAVYRRLAELGDDAGALARAVAVLGERASLPYAAELARLDGRQATAAFDRLAAAEILAKEGAPRFAHPLVAAAVYDDIPAAERGESHLMAARLLEREGATPEDVASQLLPAGCHGDPRVTAALCAAADHALARGAPAAAAIYLDRALREPPDAGERARILMELGRADSTLGRPEAEQRFAAALELASDPSERARIWLERGRALATRGDHPGAAAACEAGLQELDAEAELVHELRAVWWMSARLEPGSSPKMPDLGLEASEGELTSGQRQLLAQLALERAFAGEHSDTLVALAERAWGGGALLAAETSDGLAWSLVTAALLCADAVERELEICDEVLADAQRRGSPMAYATVSYVRAFPLLHQGRVGEAVAEAQAALDARRDGWSTFAGAAAGILALAHIERGSIAEARAALALVENDPAVQRSVEYLFVIGAQARILVAEGEPAQALRLLLRFGEMTAESGFDLSSIFSWRAEGAIAASLAGETEQARELAAGALAWAMRTGARRVIAQAHRAAGYAARGAEAMASFEAALETLNGSPPRLERVHALVELGSALRRARRRAEAREVLREGYDLALRSGAYPLAERAMTELAAAGAHTVQTSATGVHALTPSERRVAEMAAAGRTNREIAQLLFVTVKGVEYHLANTYRKLGVGGRQELREFFPE